ncbi:DUF4269 domain-containing protein [Flavobacterium branchiicola]|uniref:DUF4269 domain-containing protein n=1 Tax=Flavobacterium branchiicola TaxID=1114875 RepID=A0ABV9PAB3_9FLAO|nr:DUF4269 domain-containing protein [Flavobacterium branchiicola]MBS7254282.1 DUF4269 domain-containing protein [Flavobacterium branchiicola]
MIDFSSIDYLQSGNAKQILAYQILTENKILDTLSEFDPILVGTIPINIDIENSDLDVICYWTSKAEFVSRIRLLFENKNEFKIQEAYINNQESVIANFLIDGFEIEIFGQNIPTKEQNGYRHMLIEHQILELKGENFRQEIIKLKRKGFKTEPAFGKLLGLKVNPYQELLDYKI